jgi:hypothetical protein
VIKPKYDDITVYPDDGVMVVVDEGRVDKYGVVNSKGTFVVKLGTYDFISDFTNGYAVVKKDGKYGVINTKGKVVIKLGKYDSISDFTNGYAVVKKDGKYGVINTKGKVLIKIGKYSSIEKYSTTWSCDEYSLATAKKSSGSKVIINTAGKVVLSLSKYSIYKDYSDGMAIVVKKDQYGHSKYGYIDTAGKLVVKATYDAAYSFQNGYAIVQKDGKYKVINKKGKVLDTFSN